MYATIHVIHDIEAAIGIIFIETSKTAKQRTFEYINSPIVCAVLARRDFCSDSDFRLRGVSPPTYGRCHSEGRKQIFTLSIVKLFPIAYPYYSTHF